eukprot:2359774-Rhodomonas_salina.3
MPLLKVCGAFPDLSLQMPFLKTRESSRSSVVPFLCAQHVLVEEERAGIGVGAWNMRRSSMLETVVQEESDDRRREASQVGSRSRFRKVALTSASNPKAACGLWRCI